MTTTINNRKQSQQPIPSSSGEDDQGNLEACHRSRFRRHTITADGGFRPKIIILENPHSDADSSADRQVRNMDFSRSSPIHENDNENVEDPNHGGEIDDSFPRNSDPSRGSENQRQQEERRYHHKKTRTTPTTSSSSQNNTAKRRTGRFSSDSHRPNSEQEAASAGQHCEFRGYPKIGSHYALLHPIMSEPDGSNDSYTIDSHQAVHLQTKELKICQWMSPDQYAHFIQVRDRLNRPFVASSGIQQSRSHCQEMIELFKTSRARSIIKAIIPNRTEVVRHDGHFYLFTPQHFGSLHGYVQGQGRLSEEESRLLYRQIVQIVVYCHSVGIIVRDLKLRKFVFVDEARTMLRMSSVTDLVVCQNDNDDALEDRHGCPAYVSPEILDLTQRTYSGKAADIWSLGVLLFAMLMGRYPFYDPTAGGLFAKIRAGTYWIPPPPPTTLNEDEFPAGVGMTVDEGGGVGGWTIGLEVRLLLRSLLRRGPGQRPTAEQLSDAGWLRRGWNDSNDAAPAAVSGIGQPASLSSTVVERRRQLIAVKRRWRRQRRMRSRNHMSTSTNNNNRNSSNEEMFSIYDEESLLDEDQTVPNVLAPSIFSLNGRQHHSSAAY